MLPAHIYRIRAREIASARKYAIQRIFANPGRHELLPTYEALKAAEAAEARELGLAAVEEILAELENEND